MYLNSNRKIYKNFTPPFQLDDEFNNKKDSLVAEFEKQKGKWLKEDWKLLFNNKNNSLGSCTWNKFNNWERYIYLSNIAIKYLTLEEMIDTVRHEIAHAYQFENHKYSKHDDLFYQYCEMIGAKPKRCFDGEFFGKYKRKCSNKKCQRKTTYFNRMTKKRIRFINADYCCLKCANGKVKTYLVAGYHTNKNEIDIMLTESNLKNYV